MVFGAPSAIRTVPVLGRRTLGDWSVADPLRVVLVVVIRPAALVRRA